MNPRILIPIAAIVVLGFGGWYIDAQRARTRSTLSGFFETQPTELASRIGGRVSRILVGEGDTVAAGQRLIELEDEATRAETQAKQAQAEQARQQLAEVANGPRREDIAKQEAAVREQRAALERLQHGPLPEEIRASRAKLHEAEANLAKLKAGPRPQEIEQARAAERNAYARLAQAERGLTPEEREQARARLVQAQAAENLARRNAERASVLVDEGAISQQESDRAHADFRTAQGRTHEMEEAYKRAQEGTPAEEMEQARQAWKQAKAALDLVLAGSRREDIAAAAAEANGARENLRLLQRGSRIEDIQAAQQRLAQAQAAFAELTAGSRREQVRQAQAAARAAAENARGAQSNLAERVIASPIAGNVERILVAAGDLVSQGTPVIRMSDPTDLWIRVYVPEAQLAKVKVGDSSTLRVDGVPGEVPAIVESIATQGEFTPANLQTPDERGKQVFGVRLRLRQSDPRIKSGMYATVLRVGSWQP